MNYKKHAERTSAKVLSRFTAVAAVLLAACLVFMMPVSAWEADSSWGSNYASITEFTIQDTGDLAQFAKMVNDGKNFQGKTVKLSTDIDLENQEWTPIGSLDTEFKGTFDGNGKTISNLTITSASTDGYAGLFGTNSGTVTYLAVGGAITVTGNDMVSVGGIVGDNYGIISKCYSAVDITVTSSTAYVGGIAGSSNKEITNSYSTCDVMVTSSTSGDQDLALGGGIVGSNTGSVSFCYTAGNVTASATTAAAGGIAGLSKEDGSSISNCYALNQKVTATGTKQYANRIVAATVGLTGNSGWIAMKINDQLVTTGTETDSNGKPAYAVQFWNNLNFFTEFDTSTWDIQNNLVPVLKGQSTVPNENDVAYLKPAFTLTYNSNGGSGTVTADYTSYAKGEPEKVKSPASLTRENYNVADWNKNTDGTGESYVQGQEIHITENTILYANWTINPVTSYTVTFMNESTSVHTVSVVSGGYVNEFNDVTRTGYTLNGWKNGSVLWNFASDKVTSGITLTADWKVNQYTISFTNTGVSQVFPITQDYGTAVTAPANPNWGEGYTFVGWEPSIPTTMPAQDMTIAGKWEVKQFTITFENTGDTTIAPITQAYLTDITAPADPVWTGHTFAGWDKTIPKKMPNQDITITAQWKSPSSGGSSSSKTTYIVTFNANGGTGEMYPQTFVSGKEKALTLNFFTREGYVFAGWATSADGAVVYTDGESIKVSKSMTLYAVWNAETPDVTDEPEQPDTPEQPDEPTTPGTTEEPETPAPLIGVLAGLGAAVLLRRK